MSAAPFRVTPDTVVDDLMSARSETIAVFMKHRMMCVGCPVGGIHTITEACREHRIDVAAFMAEIAEAMAEHA